MALRSVLTLRQSRIAKVVSAIRTLTSEQLEYSEHGEPLQVIKLVNKEVPNIRNDQLRYAVIASPINPVDINIIEGVYPIQPPLPAIGGMEGVVRIEEVGSMVTDFKKGDLAISRVPVMGLWRTAGVAHPEELIKVPKDLNPIAAAMLSINPPTAYRMLKDFVYLQPGDTVLQNGANSAVGQFVIQLCKLFHATTVNIIRDGKSDEKQVKDKLSELGAEIVMTESEFKANVKNMFKSIAPPKLALNCVSGRGTIYMLSCLAPKGVMVTYGGMSKQPMELPTAPFIFKNIQSRGFWISSWNGKSSNQAERQRSTAQLASWFIEGKLQIPAHELITIRDYGRAIEDQLAGVGKKKIFWFQ